MTPDIRLVLADVDGTLVTTKKELTPEAVAAVTRLREEGILFAVTSARPPKGLKMLIEPLGLTTPLSGFNGGQITDEELHILQELTIDDADVGLIINVLLAQDLNVWVYQGTEWFVLDLNGPHVAHEAEVCQFWPRQIANFDGVRGGIVKIVGVCDNSAAITKATTVLRDQFSRDVSATTSQTYYLDVTHRDATKGNVVEFLARKYGLDREEIASIGDMGNDVSMFERSGVSIAMGNASTAVKEQATYSTQSNDDNGFADAMEMFIFS